MLLGGALLASAWVIVPLIAQRGWAAVNELFSGTGWSNGYGARHVLEWLVSGQLLDCGRLPVVTVFAALGFGLAWLAWSVGLRRSRPAGRARGMPPTRVRSHDVRVARRSHPGQRRPLLPPLHVGAQLSAILLAGTGQRGRRPPAASRSARVSQMAAPPIRAAALWGVVVLSPAWLQPAAYDAGMMTIAPQRVTTTP